MSGVEGPIALVTGAGSGIGQAMAEALAAAGYASWLVGRTQSSLEATARACGGARVNVRPTDLTQDEDVRDLVRELEVDSQRLDVLVHCAGAITRGTIEDASVETLDLQYGINVRAFYVLVQQLLPLLRRGPGQIAVINSSIVRAPRAGLASYAATKQALLVLTDVLRQELRGEGIRVLNVFPGRTATPMQASLADDSVPYRPEVLLQARDLATMVVTALQLPATAEVTEIHIRPSWAPS